MTALLGGQLQRQRGHMAQRGRSGSFTFKSSLGQPVGRRSTQRTAIEMDACEDKIAGKGAAWIVASVEASGDHEGWHILWD